MSVDRGGGSRGKGMKRVGKYEMGRTIGEGTFAKVKFAVDTDTDNAVAIKVLAKSTILKHKMVHQIKREISIMKIVRHPYIVRLYEVLASQTKIYIILELVTGGELFDRIVHRGKLPEHEARRYFQQLIDAIDYCHSKGVFHRDLKPENLLLDSSGNVKVSDFGLSALPQQGVDLLHTTCGTPNYVAPEVLSKDGYEGSAADVWSCGVILFVLMAGYLPFDETDLPALYKKIKAAEFSFPPWFSPGAKLLIKQILDPNPSTRIRIEGIRNDAWFKNNYVRNRSGEDEEVSLDDINAVFNDIEDQFVTEQTANNDSGPLIMNAFEMITLSQGLDLSVLFDRQQEYVKRQTRFVSREPAKTIIETIAAVAESMGLKVHAQNYKMRLEGVAFNKLGQFAVVLEVYEVAPSLFMTDVRKVAGDTLEYHKFYKQLCSKLEHLIWKPKTEREYRPALLRPTTC
ncbi:CBL-interacting protein kinase 24-like isoform X1 [Carex rostrata]